MKAQLVERRVLGRWKFDVFGVFLIRLLRKIVAARKGRRPMRLSSYSLELNLHFDCKKINQASKLSMKFAPKHLGMMIFMFLKTGQSLPSFTCLLSSFKCAQ